MYISNIIEGKHIQGPFCLKEENVSEKKWRGCPAYICIYYVSKMYTQWGC